ncbi:MAG: two-component system sensor histidine kinase NtrB [Planctomycetota bacterium]
MTDTSKSGATEKGAAEVLRENALQHKALFDAAYDAMFILQGGHFVDCNPRALELFGCTRDEVLGHSPFDFSPDAQPDGQDSAVKGAKKIEAALDGTPQIFEWTHSRADGTLFYTFVSLNRFELAGEDQVLAIVRDITERKQLQAQVQHQEKVAAVGMLAAGIAHEIGNPLTGISMAIEALSDKYRDEYAQKKLRLIGEHLDRISKIVRQMSDFARKPNEERKPCAVGHIVDHAMGIARFDKRARDVELEVAMTPDLPAVLVSEDQITQVFLNLVLNAFDAMEENPEDRPRRITIGGRRAESGGQGVVYVSFTDSGPGISDDVAKRIFEPFYTTKKVGSGTGLGLAVSFRIVKEHGGTIHVASPPGQGAQFTVELPVAEAE